MPKKKRKTHVGSLEYDDEVRIKGLNGRFRFRRKQPNGDLTFYGPFDTHGNAPNGMTRSFRPEKVKEILS